MEITNWNDKMDFGRHKGMTVKQVFDCDATYLWWAMMNTDRTNFSDEIKEAVQKRTEELDIEYFEGLSWEEFND